MNVHKQPAGERIHWFRSIPFFLMHLLPLGALWTGVRLRDVLLCITLYYVRMFFTTAGYHRYFAHRSYQLGRAMQFVMAFGAATAAQKGPLWWASHHRMHHAYSDTPQDVHSPLKGFWWSHVGWILSPKYVHTRESWIRDFASYPELRWLDQYYLVPPFLLALLVFLTGGWSALFTGFFLSTVLLYHGTFVINSLTHVIGERRYATPDNSRNSLILALITNGEGWHNNHHHYRSSAKQGFFWWQIDPTYYVLKLLSLFHLVKSLRGVPTRVRQSNRVKDIGTDIGLLYAQRLKLIHLMGKARHRTEKYYAEKLKEVEALIQATKKKMAMMNTMPFEKSTQ